MKRRREGFTIAEVLVGSGIFFLALMAWVETATSIQKTSRRGLSDFQLAVEQRAVSGMISAMSPSAVRTALCEVPHPYSVTDQNGNCKYYMDNIPDSAVKAWRELSQAILAWPTINKISQNSIDPKLDKPYYTNTIVPLLNKAGCMTCHAGTQKTYRVPNSYNDTGKQDLDAASMNANYPDIAQRDFGNVDHIVEPFTYRTTNNGTTTTVDPSSGKVGTLPLAKRAILTTRFGQTAIATHFQLNNVLANSQQTTNYVTFSQSTVQIEMQTYKRIGRYRDGWQCTDSLPKPAPQGPCETGELYQSFSCISQCVAWNPPKVCSCGKGCRRVCGPAACALYRSNFTCMSTSDDSTEVKDNIASASYSPGGDAPTSWQNLSDSACANAPSSVGGPWCDGVVCGSSSGLKRCIKPKTCQRMCTEPVWSKGYKCGKNCFRPPRVIGCTSQSFQFVCQSVLAPTVLNKQILSYSIDSELFDPDLKAYKHIGTQGVVQ